MSETMLQRQFSRSSIHLQGKSPVMDQRIEKYLQSAINSLWFASNLIEYRCGREFDVGDYDRACQIIDSAEDLLSSLQNKCAVAEPTTSTSSKNSANGGSTATSRYGKKAA